MPIDWDCKCGKNIYKLYEQGDQDCVLRYKCLGCGEEKTLRYEQVDYFQCAFCNERYSENEMWQSGGGIMVCPKCKDKPLK